MVILCDFDDTTAQQNVATLLLDRFDPIPGQASPRRRQLHQQYLNAEITLAEYQEMAFARLASTRGEQTAYVKQEANLREGFVELAEYCAAHAIELAIVSHGLDFYVRALLEKAGLEHIPFYAVETKERGGHTMFDYNFSQPDCPWAPGNCKCYIVEEYKERGQQVLFAGDGVSDTCPARKADFVFAKDGLLSYCQQQGLPHLELTDFHVVVDYLKKQSIEV